MEPLGLKRSRRFIGIKRRDFFNWRRDLEDNLGASQLARWLLVVALGGVGFE